jgi:hypothetical protein
LGVVNECLGKVVVRCMAVLLTGMSVQGFGRADVFQKIGGEVLKLVAIKAIRMLLPEQ